MLGMGVANAAMRRYARGLKRAFDGIELDGQYRLVTLTTPASFKGDIHRAWRMFVMRMRRRNVKMQYYCVREWNEKGTCEHIHALIRASWLDFESMRKQWTKVVNILNDSEIANVWLHVDRVNSNRGMIAYLAKYLRKSEAEIDGKESRKGRSFWYAYEWVFKAFCTWSRAMWVNGVRMEQAFRQNAHNLLGLERNDFLQRGYVFSLLVKVKCFRNITAVEYAVRRGYFREVVKRARLFRFIQSLAKVDIRASYLLEKRDIQTYYSLAVSEECAS